MRRPTREADRRTGSTDWTPSDAPVTPLAPSAARLRVRDSKSMMKDAFSLSKHRRVRLTCDHAGATRQQAQGVLCKRGGGRRARVREWGAGGGALVARGHLQMANEEAAAKSPTFDSNFVVRPASRCWPVSGPPAT